MIKIKWDNIFTWKRFNAYYAEAAIRKIYVKAIFIEMEIRGFVWKILGEHLRDFKNTGQVEHMVRFAKG